MDALRKTVLAILDKADQLLTTEPARMIGYGAAIVVYLVARLLTETHVLNLPLTFDQSLTSAVAALATVVILVESIRRFVYSPQTYIEDIADENKAGHEAAHLEEDLARWHQAVQQRIAEQKQAEQTTVLPVAPAPENNPDRQN